MSQNKLVIEVDGGQHSSQKEEDRERDSDLERSVLRSCGSGATRCWRTWKEFWRR